MIHDTIYDVLQGLVGWVGLKSRRGEPVGAVQLKVNLTHFHGRLTADPRYNSQLHASAKLHSAVDHMQSASVGMATLPEVCTAARMHVSTR